MITERRAIRWAQLWVALTCLALNAFVAHFGTGAKGWSVAPWLCASAVLVAGFGFTMALLDDLIERADARTREKPMEIDDSCKEYFSSRSQSVRR